MRKILYVVIALLIIVKLNGCIQRYTCTQLPRVEPANQYPYTLFQAKILRIDSADPSLVSFPIVFADKEFDEMYEHPDKYEDDVLIFINDSQYTYQQKVIAVFSMNQLNVCQYVDFCKKCEGLFNKKRINENLFDDVIVYPFTDEQRILANYDNEAVRDLLIHIKNSG